MVLIRKFQMLVVRTGRFISVTAWVFSLLVLPHGSERGALHHVRRRRQLVVYTAANQLSVGVAQRALTTSFGSIAFGSLIVALIQTIRFVLRSLERLRSDNAIATAIICCARCIIRQVEEMVRYFNKYAFIVVSLYGKNFVRLEVMSGACFIPWVDSYHQ